MNSSYLMTDRSQFLDKVIRENKYDEIFQDLKAVMGIDPSVEMLRILHRDADDIFDHLTNMHAAYIQTQLQKKNFKPIEACLCCKSTDLFVALDLGEQPPANSFHDNLVALEEFELKLMGCPKCFHLQLSIAVDPDILFKDYPYVSGTSKTYNDYLQAFADHYVKALGLNPTGRYKEHKRYVLDIGCNDGTLLDKFLKHDIVTHGVEPATNLAKEASERGHVVDNNYWSTKLADPWWTRYDLITALNVFAHTTEVDDFLQACKLVMHDTSILVISTSQANMIENREFDTIYHEHISFFSVNSMKTLVERNGLYLNHVRKTDIHGTSFVFEISKRESVQSIVDDSVRTDINIEQYIYQDFKQTMRDYELDVKSKIAQFKKIIETFHKSGEPVVGYGAPAKAMTLLNAANVKLDYIVDDNPLKCDKFSPGMNIPVYGSNVLQEESEDLVIIILAWNFAKEIEQRIKKLRGDHVDIILTPFPC